MLDLQTQTEFEEHDYFCVCLCLTRRCYGCQCLEFTLCQVANKSYNDFDSKNTIFKTPVHCTQSIPQVPGYLVSGVQFAQYLASAVQLAQSTFHFRRSAFSSQIKSTHPSHSQTSRLLTTSLSLGVPVPHTTQCM